MTMERFYNFTSDVVSTVKDGASFVFTTAATSLNRLRNGIPHTHSSSTPLAEGTPILPPMLRPPAIQNGPKEERPVKRRRIAVTSATRVSVVAPAHSIYSTLLASPQAATPHSSQALSTISTSSQTKLKSRRSLPIISKHLLAPSSSGLKAGVRRFRNKADGERRLSSPHTVNRGRTPAMDETIFKKLPIVSKRHSRLSTSDFQKEANKSSGTLSAAYSFSSAAATLVKKIERSANGSPRRHFETSAIPPTRVFLPRDPCMDSFVDCLQRRQRRTYDQRQKITCLCSDKLSTVHYSQAQHFVPAPKPRNTQDQSSDASDSE